MNEEPNPRTTEHRVKSWEELQRYVAKFEDPSRKPWDEVWFRGQSDANWALSTTLERRPNRRWTVAEYLRVIYRIRPAIETFTGSQFSMLDGLELEQVCRRYDHFEHELYKCATYLAHLRHGGFPSPLLDWTLSPYVAAYFAFHDARPNGDVAIYAYREGHERQANVKLGGSDDPRIVSFGPIIKTHKRHFRQQSRYTACVQFGEDGQWIFAPHDDIFGQTDHLKQDLLWKVTIPASERLNVLHFCDKVNLNEFTLFDSEEGLLKMLAMREFDLRHGR